MFNGKFIIFMKTLNLTTPITEKGTMRAACCETSITEKKSLIFKNLVVASAENTTGSGCC